MGIDRKYGVVVLAIFMGLVFIGFVHFYTSKERCEALEKQAEEKCRILCGAPSMARLPQNQFDELAQQINESIRGMAYECFDYYRMCREIEDDAVKKAVENCTQYVYNLAKKQNCSIDWYSDFELNYGYGRKNV